MQNKGINSFIYIDTDTLWLEDPAIIFTEFAKFGNDHELGFTAEVEGDAEVSEVLLWTFGVTLFCIFDMERQIVRNITRT